MPNTRMNMADFEAIVDERGTLIGIIGSNGQTTFFRRTVLATAVAKSITGTAQQQMFAAVVPAGSMGPNGFLRLFGNATCTVNATPNAKVFRVYMNNTLVCSFPVETSAASMNFDIYIRNRGHAGSQVIRGSGTDVGQVLITSVNTQTAAIDTSKEILLEVRMTHTLGTDTTTLESCSLELSPSA